MRVAFTVPVIPRGKGRPRFRQVRKFVSVYTDAETRKYEARISDFAWAAMGDRAPMDGPLRVSIRARFAPPKCCSRGECAAMMADLIRPIGKVDVDNIAKAVLDAVNKDARKPKPIEGANYDPRIICFYNDTQIVDLRIIKIYAPTPGLDIIIEDWGKA